MHRWRHHIPVRCRQGQTPGKHRDFVRCQLVRVLLSDYAMITSPDTLQAPSITFITVTSQWARWRLKSLASPLFAQAFIQAQIKESIKAPRYWPLLGGSIGHLWIPLAKGSTMSWKTVPRKNVLFDGHMILEFKVATYFQDRRSVWIAKGEIMEFHNLNYKVPYFLWSSMNNMKLYDCDHGASWITGLHIWDWFIAS